MSRDYFQTVHEVREALSAAPHSIYSGFESILSGLIASNCQMPSLGATPDQVEMLNHMIVDYARLLGQASTNQAKKTAEPLGNVLPASAVPPVAEAVVDDNEQ